jgi:nicotinamidase-related amidase
MLAFQGADTVIVAGISTSGCVRATVVDAFSLNYRVIVPEECVADRVVVPHKVNLFDMQMKYADVLPLTRVIELLEVHSDATHSK